MLSKNQSFVLGTLAVGAFAVSPLSYASGNISGDYTMRGSSSQANARPYTGTCQLTEAKTIYEVRCENANGDKYQGKGILSNDLFSLYLGEYLVVYQVRADGVLDGRWAHARSDEVGTEVLTPVE